MQDLSVGIIRAARRGDFALRDEKARVIISRDNIRQIAYSWYEISLTKGGKFTARDSENIITGLKWIPISYTLRRDIWKSICRI